MAGMIWGIGQALHEATEIDSRYARYVNRDLKDYLVPVNADIKDLQVILVPEVDNAVNPAGAGRNGQCRHCLRRRQRGLPRDGKRIRDLPIRIEQLLA